MADITVSPVPEVEPLPTVEEIEEEIYEIVFRSFYEVEKSKPAVAPKTKSTHLSTADMVNIAVKKLAEKNGSSLQAIKKYMAATYKFDTTKNAFLIKKYLKSAVASGILVRTRGKGAAGSFKLAIHKEAAKPNTKAVTAKKPAAKKTGVIKAERKKHAAPNRAAVAKKSKAPKCPKAKKLVKAPTAKLKASKSKRTAAKTAAKRTTVRAK